MQSFSAHDAKARFGKPLDTAHREPVTTEKHGHAVAVMVSKEEFNDINAMKCTTSYTTIHPFHQ